MRPDLQAVRHLKYSRQDTENNQTHQTGDYHDDNRRNKLRDHANRPVKFALINVGDSLHGLGEMPRLFAYGHHVGKQIRKHVLLLQRGGERRAIDNRPAYLAKLDFEKAVAGDFGYEIKRAEQGNSIFDQSSQCPRELRVITMANDSPISRDEQPEAIPSDASFFSADNGAETNDCANHHQSADPPVASDRVMNLQQN